MPTSRRPRRVIRSRYKRHSSLTVQVSQEACPFLRRRIFHRRNRPLFWNLEEPRTCQGGLKDGKFKDAIVRDFGSAEGFKKQFNAATVGIQGSG